MTVGITTTGQHDRKVSTFSCVCFKKKRYFNNLLLYFSDRDLGLYNTFSLNNLIIFVLNKSKTVLASSNWSLRICIDSWIKDNALHLINETAAKGLGLLLRVAMKLIERFRVF